MNGLPETFSIREAFDILGLQGSRKGLARHLEAQGFTKSAWYDDRSRDTRMIWRHPKHAPTMKSCPCRCHTGTCGASDMDLAERTIRMIMSLRPHDVKVIEEVDALVRRAGVDHAKAALAIGKTARPSLYDDVPF